MYVPFKRSAYSCDSKKMGPESRLIIGQDLWLKPKKLWWNTERISCNRKIRSFSPSLSGKNQIYNKNRARLPEMDSKLKENYKQTCKLASSSFQVRFRSGPQSCHKISSSRRTFASTNDRRGHDLPVRWLSIAGNKYRRRQKQSYGPKN